MDIENKSSLILALITLFTVREIQPIPKESRLRSMPLTIEHVAIHEAVKGNIMSIYIKSYLSVFLLLLAFESSSITYPSEPRRFSVGFNASGVLVKGFNLNYCSVTAIAENAAITAAHCNPRVGHKVKFVDELYAKTGEAYSRTIYKVISHEKYLFRVREEPPSRFSSSTGKQGRTQFDIAIVFFSGGLPSNVVPAILSADLPKENFEFTGIGYGDYKSLRTISPQPANFVELRAYKAAIRAKHTGKFYEDNDHVVQLRSINEGAYWCYGDSGGGLFSGNSQDPVVEGIESYVLGDPRNVECSRGVAHFVRIDKLRDWIEDALD